MFNYLIDKPGMRSDLPLFIITLVVLDLVLKGYALWCSARRGQNVWFIALLVLNTIGILPLVYLLLNRAPPAAKPRKHAK